LYATLAFIELIYVTFTVQDITTLGVVYVRYCGYVVVVKVEGGTNDNANSSFHQNNEVFDQPEGGANALNINRFLNPSVICIIQFF
jgi:hypothetical protein